MSDDEADQHGEEPSDERARRIQDEAARLGLAVVGEATAMSSGDLEAIVASEQNLRDTVGELVDVPFTPQQEEIVETLGAMSGSITAGLGAALAQEQDRDAGDVLSGAASSILWQQRLATGDLADAESTAERPDTDDER